MKINILQFLKGLLCLVVLFSFVGCGRVIQDEKEAQFIVIFRAEYPKTDAEKESLKPQVLKKLCELKSETKRLSELNYDLRWQKSTMRPSTPEEVAEFNRISDLVAHTSRQFREANDKYEVAKDITEYEFKLWREILALDNGR